MVTLKEVREVLKKYGSNLERLKYLSELLERTDDKELIKELKVMIKNIRELEAVSQIEMKGRVEWSIPEEEPEEERRLERQVVGAPIIEEKEEKEKKIEYTLGSGVDLYREGTRGSNVVYENLKSNEGKSFIERDSSLMGGGVEKQYMGEDIDKSHEDIMGNISMGKYESPVQEKKGYASLSEELHDKARKKHLH